MTSAVACLAEELFFRGFLLLRASALVRFWRENLLTSALFAAIHWPGWLASLGPRPGLTVMSLSVFALGLLLGYLLRETGSVWPCVTVHLANNALASLLVPAR
jgi:membrane protease YdiL (CAAX protease family)